MVSEWHMGSRVIASHRGVLNVQNQDVQNMLVTMDIENCYKWSEGIRFVLLMNRVCYDGITLPLSSYIWLWY
jgi:hypothetical protein